MENRPKVVVEPPTSRGLREVKIGGETVGSAWSLRGLRKILSRHGYPEDMDVEDRTSVCWRAGGSQTWPDRPMKRHATIALMVAGLLGSMALLTVVGAPDALGALTFAGRATGFLFMLAGSVQGVAASAALDYWGKRRLKLSGPVILLGVLITLATSSLLLFLWLQETEYTDYLLAYFPLWSWSLWALWLLLREKAWRGLPHPKSFAIGVTATAVIASANLTYSAVYQPAASPLLFRLEAKFGKPEMDTERSFMHLPLTLRAKNVGKVPAYIITDFYSVYGHLTKFSSTDNGLKDLRKAMEEESDAGLYVSRPEYKTISTGRFYSVGQWIEPGGEYTAERLIRIPMTAKFDAVEALFMLDLMRKDRGRIDEGEFSTAHFSWDKGEGRFYHPPGEYGDNLIYHGRVRHNNNMINVTRRPRYVTSVWSADSEGSVAYSSISSFSFNPEDRPDEREEMRELERYGVVSVYGESLIPFAALTNNIGSQKAGS